MRRLSLCALALAVATLLAASATAGAATWTVQTTPNPATALASSFAGVSCSGASACAAVGRWDDGSGLPAALSQDWNGSSWTQRTPAVPAGAVTTEFSGISCTASNACTAVGNYDPGTGVPVTLVQRWNGSSWATQTSPNPAGHQGSYLSSVSCTTSTECTAVGTYVDSLGVQKTLAMRWTSGRWSIQSTPNPAGASAAFLSGVSCTSSTACTAVGTSVDSLGVRTTLAMALSGGTWTIQRTPNGAGASASFLTGVSCAAAGSCTAVGVSTDSLGVASPLAITFASGSWSLATAARPAGVAGAALTGVSCTTTTVCTAVGYSYDASFTFRPLAENRSGVTWTVVSTPLPAGATAGRLEGVSCSATAVCTGVGYYFDANGDQKTLALRYV